MVAPDSSEGREAAVCARCFHDEHQGECTRWVSNVAGGVRCGCPGVAVCANCGKPKGGHVEVLGVFYCYEFTPATSGEDATATFAPTAPPPAAPSEEPYYRAIHDVTCSYRRHGPPYPCSCNEAEAVREEAHRRDLYYDPNLYRAYSIGRQTSEREMASVRDLVDELRARLATAEAERDRLRELGGDHLITALAFLAGHHDRKRAEAADAIHSRVTDEEIANCERHVAHHTEQLYQIGELTALLGGRNAYPRRAPSTGTTPP